MRYYLGQCEYKWAHTAEQGNERMEQIWIRRELGEDLYREINHKNYRLVLQRSNGIVPELYCRCDIFVDIINEDHALLFEIKYGKQRIERV
jgi:hypothetical protein